MAEYKYTPADFKSDQIVKWCPGCGDHAILNAVQRAMPEVALPTLYMCWQTDECLQRSCNLRQ